MDCVKNLTQEPLEKWSFATGSNDKNKKSEPLTELAFTLFPNLIYCLKLQGSK